MIDKKSFTVHTLKAALWAIVFAVIQVTIAFLVAPVYLKITGQSIEKLNEASELIYVVYIVEALVATSLYFSFKDKVKDTRIIKKKEYPIEFLIPYGLLLNFVFSLILSFIPEGLIEKLNYNVSYDDFNSTNIFLVVIAVGICVPIAEEIFFRFLVFNNLTKAYNGLYACLGSAILFGLLHGNFIQAVYSGLIGFCLGREYFLSGARLMVPIIIHCAVNCYTVIISNLVKQENVLIVQILTVILSWVISDIVYKRRNKKLLTT